MFSWSYWKAGCDWLRSFKQNIPLFRGDLFHLALRLGVALV
jgi:hypothetical protein